MSLLSQHGATVSVGVHFGTTLIECSEYLGFSLVSSEPDSDLFNTSMFISEAKLVYYLKRTDPLHIDSTKVGGR